VYFAPEEQRGGVFGTAAEMVSFLNNSRVRSWVEEDKLSKRDKFSPYDFVRSSGETMIALSKEGIGSTGPLTAALVAWILEEAEDYADTQPHGRLRVPLMAILDEVANVCRLKDLPDLMSHYGSRGIPTWPILQNWAQGCRVWQEEGMRQLWSAANIRIVGSGQSDAKHLKEISDLVGPRLVTEYSANSSSGGMGRGNYSRNISQRSEAVLDVDDIAAFAPGECLVLPSGDRPYMAVTVPWFDRPEMQPAVAASIAEFEPA
jgi:type IV secretory pathway TraG/TraD family ATPase VirD4